MRAFRERLTRRIFAMEMGRRWEVISAIISGGRVVRVGVVSSAILGMSGGEEVRVGVVFSAILRMSFLSLALSGMLLLCSGTEETERGRG